MPRRRYTLLFLALVIIIGPLLFSRIFPLHRGDGKIINKGWIRIGYRYIVHFEPFVFRQGSIRKVYEFSGIPDEHYRFELDMLSGDGNQANTLSFPESLLFLDDLKDSQVETTITVIENGSEILHSEGFIPEKWTRLSAINYENFYELVLDRGAQYQIIITIKSQKVLLEPLTLTPVLYGGDSYVF